MRRLLYLCTIICGIALSGCHKKNNTDDATTLDLVRDSIFLYAKETYYWNDALPEYDVFQPRSYVGNTVLGGLQAEVDALSQYKKNPDTGNPYEYYTPSPGEAKYSFIDQGQTSTALGGTNADFGFAVTKISNTDLRVRYVYPGSPAGTAGLHRGEQIVKINGRSGLDVGNAADYNFVISALSASPISMTLKRGDGTTYDVSVTATAYTVNPVITYKVIDAGNGKKIGYIVLNSFTSPANAKPKLDEAFNYFTQNTITDLVVDLRYNGGGYVSTSEYLANLIVPPIKDGSLMYNTYFNSILTSGKEVLLKNQWRRDEKNVLYNYGQIDYSVEANAVNFAKAGSLNVPRVFFIVSGSTASASELAINNLIPKMDVKLIGKTTYGKPVGFFGININTYQLYMPQFETKNSLYGGRYYTGMQPGSANYPGVNDNDDLTKDFGDPTEGLLAHAINYVKTGNYGLNLQIQSAGGNSAAANPVSIGKEGFNGMIYDKPFKTKK